MSDTTDDINEDQINPTDESLQSVSIADESTEEFLDDADDDFESEFGEDTEELTPNDLFGLDPLDVLTMEEAAEYLKVSPAAVRRAIKEQNLPAKNIGGDFRLLRDAVANWLRGEEPAAQQQQKARQDYSKAPATPAAAEEPTYPPKSSYSSGSEQGQGEYRSRQRYSEGGQQYGNRQGNQYGSRGGQYGGGGSQYGGGQTGGGQSGGRQYGSGQTGGGQSGGGQSGGYGSYSQPPRRPFRAEEGQSEGSYGSQQGSYGAPASGGYGQGSGGGGGSRYGSGGGGGYQGGGGGGGYAGGGQRYGGGPKRKNKRQVFENERGKRMDRRKEGESTDTPE